jgi:very-short-patch-repair endonuclease
VALVVEPGVFDRYRAEATESHTHALVREGVVIVPNPSPPTIEERLYAAGLMVREIDGPSQRLAADGADDELLQAFGEAVRRLRDRSTRQADDRARSAAERFLFLRLESLAQTAGKFKLNDTPGFRFGPADAEVDLLARELGLAVEIDGYYHFQDADAYRRDRRKDWQLQRRGYLVLRFLAEDVTTRLGEVLDTILAAVDDCTREPRSMRTIPP